MLLNGMGAMPSRFKDWEEKECNSINSGWVLLGNFLCGRLFEPTASCPAIPQIILPLTVAGCLTLLQKCLT